MQKISVVIICKNESDVIAKTIASLHGLTDDIIVYDNGSSDNTIEIAKAAGAKVLSGTWEGFGKTKMKANSFAKYDWILSLDADEMIDSQLRDELLSTSFNNENIVYKIRFRNFLGHKMLRFGEWGNDSHNRIFNRNKVRWNSEAVHETLIMPPGTVVTTIRTGFILHRTMKDTKDYAEKTVRYAMLSADKYFLQGKKSSFIKMRLSPVFTFINYYLFRLGILDGYAGYVCAKMTAHYTFLKYARLQELWEAKPQSD